MRVVLMILAVAAMAVLPVAAAQQAKASTAPAAPTRATKAAPAPGSLTNINTATQAQLEALPGVGAKAAQRILDYRKEHGNFKKLEDILEMSRSCPYLLMFLRLSAHRGVARNR